MKRRQKVLNETMPNVDQIDISLFSNNHGHKHLTFPFVGGSWMYILLMMSQKREKLLLFLTNCCFTLCARPNSGFAWKRSRENNSTWIKFKMASRLTLLRNLTFRRNLRLLCSQVRRSLYHKVSLPWFFEMTTYFFQSRPSLARTRSILPHASFQLNAISFDKVTSRVFKKSCCNILLLLFF